MIVLPAQTPAVVLTGEGYFVRKSNLLAGIFTEKNVYASVNCLFIYTCKKENCFYNTSVHYTFIKTALFLFVLSITSHT